MASRIVASRDTGNYDVALLRDDGVYSVRVTYTGTYGSDHEATIDLDGVDDARVKDMKNWFRAHTRGDLDVAALLAQAGYDDYTNEVRRPRPIDVVL